MEPSPYQAVRHAALLSTARGCGFGALAIITAMMGFAGDPVNALRFGGFATLLTAVILVLKAWRAPSLAYRKTEVWLLLEADSRPGDEHAQGLVAAARIEAFYRFALIYSVLGAIFLTGALLAAALAGG